MFVILSDINECEENHLNNCQSKFDCVNTNGSYTCNNKQSQDSQQPNMIRNMILVGMSHTHYYFSFGKLYPLNTEHKMNFEREVC